jgi:short-subunit dehydrogenase
MTVTVVTGASSGIGRSLARRLAARGDPVAVLARRAELLETLVEEIAAAGGRALALPCDVTDRDGARRALGEAERALGPVERLIANAGGGAPARVEDFRAEDVEHCLALNVVGVANCIEAVLPGMLERRAGHLVATSSLAGYRGLPNAAAYSAAKGALTNLMESLRVDLRGRGVDVTVLAPGFVRVKPRKPGKRGRPLELDLEDATARMHRAILRRDPFYAFPVPLVLAVRFGRWLPARIYDRLLAGRGPRGGVGRRPPA